MLLWVSLSLEIHYLNGKWKMVSSWLQLKCLAIILFLVYNFFLCLSNILFQDKAMYWTTQTQIAEAGSITEDCLVHPLSEQGQTEQGAQDHVLSAKGGHPTTSQGSLSNVWSLTIKILVKCCILQILASLNHHKKNKIEISLNEQIHISS